MSRQDKLTVLLNADKNIFSSSDLATLWGITNKNTLWTTLRRYVQNKTLHRLRKGLYSKVEPSRLNPFEIGCALAGPFSYVSLETVLQQHGVIMQHVEKITLIGARFSELSYGDTIFGVKSIKPNFLFNRIGIEDKKGYSIASLERAVADIGHYNPKYYFDNEVPVNWDRVAEIKRLVGY